MRHKPQPLSPEQGIQYALRLLKQRSYSIHTLSQKLQLRGLTEEESLMITDKLQEWRLLDDERYAESLIKNETIYRKQSLQRLGQKLYAKGISKEVAEKVMPNREETDEQELENAKYQGEKYLKKIGELNYETRTKLMSYLYRKGFPSGVIAKVITHLKTLQNQSDAL